jgi:hypothetical protein
MGSTEEDYAYGSGNGGRSCTGLSCLVVILSVVFLGFLYLVPLALDGVVTRADLFSPWTDAFGFTCCCIGTIGLIIGVVLIFIDDPEAAKQREHDKKVAARKSKQGK